MWLFPILFLLHSPEKHLRMKISNYLHKHTQQFHRNNVFIAMANHHLSMFICYDALYNSLQIASINTNLFRECEQICFLFISCSCSSKFTLFIENQINNIYTQNPQQNLDLNSDNMLTSYINVLYWKFCCNKRPLRANYIKKSEESFFLFFLL